MSDFEDLQMKKDLMVEEKNQSFKKKWAIEDELSQLKQSKSAHRLKGDVSAVTKVNMQEKNLQSELYELNNRVNTINKELALIEEQFSVIEFEKINQTYISNERLSKKEIAKLINKSTDISERFDSLIKEYSSFLKTLDSHSKKIARKGIWENNLDLLKTEIKDVIEDLHNHQNHTMEFSQFNDLISILNDADEILENMKFNFNSSRRLLLNFNTTIMEYNEFSSQIDVDLKDIPEKFCEDDFKLIKIKINYNLLLLSKNKKFSFKFNQADELNDILTTSIQDLNEMKSIFNKSQNLLMIFSSVIEDFRKFLTKLDENIENFGSAYACDDLNEMRNQINAQKKHLLILLKKYFDFNELDSISEMLVNKSKYLEKMENKLRRSVKLSIDFKNLIDDYSIFLNNIDSDLKNNPKLILTEDLSSLIKEANDKKQNLIYHQKKCFDFNRFNELNDLIGVLIKDLDNLEKSFNQRKIDIYNNLVLNATSLLNEKLDTCSKLNSKVSLLIDNTVKFDDLIDYSELLKNLKELNAELSHKFENLIMIKDNIDKRTLDESRTSQIYNNESYYQNNLNHLKNLTNTLNHFDFSDFEKNIDEQQELYEKLAIQNETLLNEDVRNVLDNFEKSFNKPMFRRQLRRYNLNDDELEIVKNEIIEDIINGVIVDENANFKQIIKTRCSEFKKTHDEFDDSKLDDILDIDDFNEFEEEIIIECKNLVKKDLINGNVTVNNAKLKFKKYLNKKIDENNQLKELDEIKNDPSVPRIKIHLSADETNEVYSIVRNEIISEFGIRNSVESRVYYWCNQKIRENQSKARGRLNVIKREFSNLTQLNLQEQNEFIIKIEFLINENKIKPYEITEENIIKLSYDFRDNKL